MLANQLKAYSRLPWQCNDHFLLMNYNYFLRSLTIALLLPCMYASAQAVNDHKYKLLFLGNSYIYVNDLPSVLTAAAASVGDTVVSSGNTIGGYTLQQHAQNATSRSLIAGGGWDYVITQEQSQWPSFPDDHVDTDMFPYARTLDSLVHVYNSCGRTMYYMTWGRQNGDADNCAFWPPVCTYSGMDSLLHLRYMAMADSNNAVVSPVGAVWRYVRNNYPSITLYQSDASHPEAAGTYLAAVTFYTAIFKRDPTLITYNGSLAATAAANIRLAAKKVVYDSMSKWHIKQYDVQAQFTYTVTGNTVTFTNTSANATNYTWIYGDGQTSTLTGPTHNYSVRGVYTVKLVAIKCGKSDTMKVTVDLNPVKVGNIANAGEMQLMPNPAHNILQLQSAVFTQCACSITICNSLGQQVHSVWATNDATQQVDLSGLTSGIYMISVTAADGQIYKRMFVKE